MGRGEQMHRRQRTFAELLTRSLAVSGLVYGIVIAYALPMSLLAQSSETPARLGPDASSLSRVTGHAGWKRAYADRFRGCVDIAEWAASDVPTTVVVVRRGGGLGRMSFDEAIRRATTAAAADDVWTIGACG
jgi:hypothetical protein